jgi:hypothetical protein
MLDVQNFGSVFKHCVAALLLGISVAANLHTTRLATIHGAPSIAVNGWFSDNNTFKTDAGPVCTKK